MTLTPGPIFQGRGERLLGVNPRRMLAAADQWQGYEQMTRVSVDVA
jgi:hypothetical protein